MKKSVAAVVVTHNRKHLLAECIGSLLSQTYQLQKILIIDNGSSDGTYEYINNRGYLDLPVVQYIRHEDNLGGAGGFYSGIKRGFLEGYDWLWTMDDDAEPKADALEELSRFFEKSDEIVALASHVVDMTGKMANYQRGLFNLSNPFKSIVEPVQVSEDDAFVEIDHSSFVGLCVKKEAVEKIGFPEKRFFIHVDDLEYCKRLRDHGKVLLIPKSVIVHKESANQNIIRKRFWIFSSQRIRYEKLWTHYFIRRNSVYFMKKHAKNKMTFWLWITATLVRSSVAIFLFDDFKIKRFKFIISAMIDGFIGTFDNTKPKYLLYN